MQTTPQSVTSDVIVVAVRGDRVLPTSISHLRWP